MMSLCSCVCVCVWGAFFKLFFDTLCKVLVTGACGGLESGFLDKSFALWTAKSGGKNSAVV